MGKDKQKKAQRAESGKDAKILKLEAEIVDIKDVTKKHTDELRVGKDAEIENLKNLLWSTKSHLQECERSLEESQKRVRELEAVLASVASKVTVSATTEPTEVSRG